MFKNSGSAIVNATRELFLHWRGLAIVAGLYLLLLAGLYLFITTKEATRTQLALTLVLSIAAPMLFFTLQTATAKFWTTKSGGKLIVNSLLNSWKLLLVTIPVVGISVLVIYGLNKLQGRFDVSNAGALVNVYALQPPTQAPRQLHWGTVAITTARYLLLGVVTPLMLMHLWICTTRDGLRKSVRRAISQLKQTFATSSVLIYIAGFLVFAAVPYFLLNHKTTSTRPWLELGLFTTKLIAVFCLTLFGWLITVRALSTATATATPDAAKGA